MGNVTISSDYACISEGNLEAEVYLLVDAHPENRGVWAWRVITPDGMCSSGIDHHIYSGANRIGSNGREIILTLAGFLTAFAEAQHYPHSENRDLFPSMLEPHAADVADMINLNVIEED